MHQDSNVLLRQDHGRVRVLTLNRPDKMNAYNGDMHQALVEAVEQADADPAIRAIIMTGAGKAYCAGADISAGFDSVASQAPDYDHPKHGMVGRDMGGILNLKIYACETPIIGAINGVAVGIGATQLLPMDIRIASQGAKFAFPFSRRGIVWDGAASYFLPRLVGVGKASEWGVTGRMIEAEEALSSGLLSQLVAEPEVMTRAMEIAQDIAQNCSPQSTAQIKSLLRKGVESHSPFESHIDESVALNKAFISHDCREGVSAFLEKRKPNFKDPS